MRLWPASYTLATETGLPHHRLYDHHADLVTRFKTNANGGPIPINAEALQRQLADALTQSDQFEVGKQTLQRRIDTLTAVIIELTHRTRQIRSSPCRPAVAG